VAIETEALGSIQIAVLVLLSEYLLLCRFKKRRLKLVLKTTYRNFLHFDLRLEKILKKSQNL
jgi:hypothetical protein